MFVAICSNSLTGNAAKIAPIIAAIAVGIGIEQFTPIARVGHTNAAGAAFNRREIADDQHRSTGIC